LDAVRAALLRLASVLRAVPWGPITPASLGTPSPSLRWPLWPSWPPRPGASPGGRH